MIVFRITLAQYSNSLIASGKSARWNSNGTFVIYASSSRALACLENLVHRSGEGLNHLFKTLIIEIPDHLMKEECPLHTLPNNWSSFKGQLHTKFIGDGWVKSNRAPVLKVPSAIIKEEFNYLINPAHIDFGKIKILAVEDFLFDNRFLSNPR